MQIENIIRSTNCLDIINKLDDLMFELLYSKTDGYINLSDKTAIDQAQKTVEKFDKQASLITEQSDVADIQELVLEKRNELIVKIKDHYKSCAVNWAKMSFDKLVQNYLFLSSINKENKSKLQKYYNRLISACEWISNIINIDCNKLKNQIQKQFKDALNSKDMDYLPKNSPLKSDVKTFLNLRKLCLENQDEFIKLDFNSYLEKLSKEDINYFNRLKITLATSKKVSLFDEIMLVDEATVMLNLDDSQKYYFIKSVDNEILNNQSKMTDELKIKLIKKRMLIFKNPSKYYKALLTSSLTE